MEIDHTLLALSNFEKFNIYSKKTSDGNDLDMLWAEFLITGERKAVLHIINVLEWPDRVREKLNNWLVLKPPKKFLADWRHKRKIRFFSSDGIIAAWTRQGHRSGQAGDSWNRPNSSLEQ